MKKLLATVLTAFLFFFAQAKYRNDVFLPGSKDNPKGFYLFPDQDFNAIYDLQPGDTVGFLPGYYGDINLGPGKNVNGITFMVDPNNKDTVFIKWFGLGNNAQDCNFLGKSKYLDYGLKLSDPVHFGLSWACTGKMEAAWFISDNNRIGVQLLNIKGQTYAKNEQQLYLHDVIIIRPLGEAVYIGYVNEAAFPAKPKVERVHVINAGWDALQFKSCSSIEIYDCTVDGSGLAKEYGQDHGIIIGHNTNGATIKGNKVKRVNGMGFFLAGWGTFDLECNTIEGNAAAVMSRNSFPESDQQNIGYQKIIFKNNELTGLSGVLMSALYENNGKPVTINAQNNKATGAWDINPAISFTNVNNNPFIVPACGGMIPLPIQETPRPQPKPGKKYSFIVSDYIGRKLFERSNAELQQVRNQLKNGRYPLGSYILHFTDGKDVFVEKFINAR